MAQVCHALLFRGADPPKPLRPVLQSGFVTDPGAARSWWAIVVLDETAELKKGDRTVGVARQHAGITGQVENCQTVVFAAYVTARAHTLFDFRLYLPKQWCEDKQRRERARVPNDVESSTKPALGTAMITAAVDVGAKNATSKARGKQAWTSTRSGPGTLSAGAPCCPCAPRRCWPSPLPARPRPPWSLPPRRQPAARGLARHGQAACHRRRPATGRRPRPGQGQRARGPPPPPAGHHADEPGRPRPRLRLVTMATTPPGPRPMAPLPRPAQSRARHLTIARRKGPSYNEPGRSAGRPRTRRTRVLPSSVGLGHASGQHRESFSGQAGQGSRAARHRHEDRFGRAGHRWPAAP